jgi:hypothetical protein
MTMLDEPATVGLLTEPEAARFLNIRPQSLSNWRCTKKVSIPFIKIGRCVRYRVSDLQAFLEHNLVGAETPQN